DFQALSVFFVISGFIMTYITRADADHFLQQRLVRIVPLYWLCTLGALAAAWLLRDTGRTWADAGMEMSSRACCSFPTATCTAKSSRYSRSDGRSISKCSFTRCSPSGS